MKYVCREGGVLTITEGRAVDHVVFEACARCREGAYEARDASGDWVAECECFRLCGQGGTSAEAVESMEHVVAGYVSAYWEVGGLDAVAELLSPDEWERQG